MAYQFQKEVQRELDTRFPRGPRGSSQNQFRQGFYFFRVQRRSLEESVNLAITGVRRHDATFVPRSIPHVARRNAALP